MVEPAKTSRLVTFATALAVVAILYLARDVLIPFALAALVSFFLAPLTARLERLIGRVAAVITVVLLTCGALGGITYLVAGQLTQLAAMLPEYRENIASKLATIRGGALEKASEAVQQIEEDIQAQHADKKKEEKKEEEKKEEEKKAAAPTQVEDRPPREDPATTVQKVLVVEPQPTSFELVVGALGPMLGPLGTGGMVIVLVLFMLLARVDLRDRIVRLMGRGRIKVTTEAMDEAGKRVSRYLLMQTLINAIHGVAVAVGMFFLDVPNFLFWGLFSAVLRFVPYAGPTIAAAMPILVALAVFDDWAKPLTVLGYFVVLEVLSNNLLEPWLYGSSAGVSPLAVIVTSIFWAWLWGPVGLLLATPLTVCMVVIGKHVPQFHFINILLGDEPVLEPHDRFYQRLVAMDHEGAAAVAEKFLQQTGSLVEVYDTVIIPALPLAEADLLDDRTDERRAHFIHGALRDVIEELAEVADRRATAASDDAAKEEEKATAKAGKNDKSTKTEAPPPVAPPSLPAGFFVLALPALNEADELVGAMLAHCVRARGARSEAVAQLARGSGMADVVRQHGADVVCISALPPSAALHARQVYKPLVARFPSLPVLIGLWNTSRPIEEAHDRVGSGVAIPIVRTLKDALAELERIACKVPVSETLSSRGPSAAATES